MTKYRILRSFSDPYSGKLYTLSSDANKNIISLKEGAVTKMLVQSKHIADVVSENAFGGIPSFGVKNPSGEQGKEGSPEGSESSTASSNNQDTEKTATDNSSTAPTGKNKTPKGK